MAAFDRDFSYAYFEKLVKAMQERWIPCCFGEAGEVLETTSKPLVFLRHDVDVCLDRAVEMGRLEAELGMPSTYMVLTKCRLYDLQSAATRSALRELRRCGHEVGLHFDIEAEWDPAGEETLEEAVRRARGSLEDALGEPVRSFSYHRPHANLQGGDFEFAGLVNAYAQRLTRVYMSDSKGSWRDGEPLPRLATAEPQHLVQVLIHPIWWGPEHQAPVERLESFFSQHTAGHSQAFAEQFDAALAHSVPAVRRGGALVRSVVA
jgi:hypothetical protein